MGVSGRAARPKSQGSKQVGYVMPGSPFKTSGGKDCWTTTGEKAGFLRAGTAVARQPYYTLVYRSLWGLRVVASLVGGHHALSSAKVGTCRACS